MDQNLWSCCEDSLALQQWSQRWTLKSFLNVQYIFLPGFQYWAPLFISGVLWLKFKAFLQCPNLQSPFHQLSIHLKECQNALEQFYYQRKQETSFYCLQILRRFNMWNIIGDAYLETLLSGWDLFQICITVFTT